MFDIPTEPYHFEVIQDHSDYKMAIEKSSVQAKNLSLKGKEYPVIQAWIHTQYPEPYYKQVHHQTGKNKLVFSQWYLSYFSCADKADAGTVFFGGSRQIEFSSKAADFRFFQIAQRENRAFELEGLEAVEEIALVFVLIQTFEQVMHAVADFFACIVSGGNGIRALFYGVVQKAFEFDFGVAQHIRIRRAPRAVLFEEISEYVVFVLGGEVDDVDVYADDVGDGNGIERVLLDAAIFVIVVILPVLHKHTAHLITLLFEQGGGYGGIDTAGESDDDV